MNLTLLKSVCTCCIAIASFSSQAMILNGGFETGSYVGWSGVGDVSVQDSTFGSGPTQGNYELLVTNLPAPNVPEDSVSGTPSVIDTEFYNFMGITSLDLAMYFSTLPLAHDGNYRPLGPYEGSAVKQSVFAQSGDLLSFDFNVLTDEGGSTPGDSVDHAIITINGTNFISVLGDDTLLGLSSTIFDRETGFASFFYSIPTTGLYDIAIGVFDGADVFGKTGILVDNFHLGPVEVSNPTTLYLVLLGLLVVMLTSQQAGGNRKLSC